MWMLVEATRSTKQRSETEQELVRYSLYRRGSSRNVKKGTQLGLSLFPAVFKGGYNGAIPWQTILIIPALRVTGAWGSLRGFSWRSF
jgi:hypothetical protein